MYLPEDFHRYTSLLMGEHLFSQFEKGLNDKSPVSIRLNRFKCNDVEIPMSDGKVEWCSDGSGVYLNERAPFTFDPLLHAGYYYVQEASSMFLHSVLAQFVSAPVTMLDLCAAPGGKTTVARAVLPEESRLVCNEPMRTRANILSENIQKFGHPNVIVTNNYPKDYRKSGMKFDIILCDVPCSGEGMFRKDSGAIDAWSVQNVDNCWRLQRDIVADIWDCLNPDGLMVYSTCTFNTKENEENVAWICSELGAEVLSVDVDSSWQIKESLLKGFEKPVYRFIPGVTRGEGLFMAVMRKTSDGSSKMATTSVRKQNTKVSNSVCSSWICNDDAYDIVHQGEKIIAVPKTMTDLYGSSINKLNVLHAGVTLGTVKGKDIIPDQSLALSTALNRKAFTEVPVEYHQAINYLRKEAIVLPADTPKGFVLLTFNGAPLGFEKNIGNRANNMYPTEWKIKSSHVPEDYSPIIIPKQK